MYYRLNGKKINIMDPIKLLGVDYGYGGIFSRPELWAMVGITQHPDEVIPDTALNHVTMNDDGTYTAIPKTQAELDAEALASFKATVPERVSMRQARLALLAAGKLADVNNAISGIAGAAGEAARIEWEFSSEVWRNKALVLSLGAVLGLTERQLDDLFIAAGEID